MLKIHLPLLIFLREMKMLNGLIIQCFPHTPTMSWPKQFFRKGVGRYLALELKEAERQVLSLSKTLTYFHI